MKRDVANAARAPDRRHFLRCSIGAAALAVVTAAAGEALLTYKPWLGCQALEHSTWDMPFQKAGDVPSRMLELIRYATLAPSGHNAQPWKFAVAESTIWIIPDYSRRLPAVDPIDRELWISLGCALENLVIAAESNGYSACVIYPADGADHLTVALTASTAGRVLSPLFDAIPHRQNTRSLYDGRPVPQSDLSMIAAVRDAKEAFPIILTGTSYKEAILEYVKSGNQLQYRSTAYLDELISWLRFNNAEAMRSQDGLDTRCSGNPQLPRWLGKRFVTGASAEQQSNIDEQNIRSSSGIIAIASAKDDKRHWIETGRLYERIALTLTAMGLKIAFLNQPVEVGDLRSQLQGYLKLGAARPQLLLRFGHADPMPLSLRRPVDQVLASI